MLILQSLPFLSAVAIALLENSRINAYAFWRDARIHTAELIGIRPVGLRHRIARALAAERSPPGRDAAAFRRRLKRRRIHIRRARYRPVGVESFARREEPPRARGVA